MAKCNVLSFKPGDLIYKGEPFVHAANPNVRKVICDFCFKRFVAINSCIFCKYVGYCSKGCQLGAWCDHKKECKRLKYLPSCSDAINIRLIGKLILKLKSVSRNYSETVDSYTRSFSDLSGRINDKAEKTLFHYGVYSRISTFIGKDNMPSEEETLEIIWKVANNISPVVEGSVIYGAALYIGGSLFKHACVPNAVLSFNGPNMELRALKDISCTDICDVNYSCFKFVETDESPDLIYERSGRKCKCKDCSLPYGESVLSKILDKEEAYPALQVSKDLLQKLYVLKPGDYAKDKVLQLTIAACLKKQEGVLGDTNIYRMKLFAQVIRLSSQPKECIAHCSKLAKCLSLAFGDATPELKWVYLFMFVRYSELGNLENVQKYKDKCLKLLRLHGHEKTIEFLEAADIMKGQSIFLKDLISATNGLMFRH